MNETKKYQVTIGGEIYSLVSDESEEQVLKVAHRIDSLMRLLSERAGIRDTKKAAVLAALQMASMLAALEERSAALTQEHERLTRLLDDAFTQLI